VFGGHLGRFVVEFRFIAHGGRANVLLSGSASTHLETFARMRSDPAIPFHPPREPRRGGLNISAVMVKEEHRRAFMSNPPATGS
jgi:hypothetical protein